MVGRSYRITDRPERKQMEVEVWHRGINTYDLLDTLVNDGYLHPDISNRLKTVTADGWVDVGNTLTIDFSAITDEAVLPSKMRDKRKEQAMARKVMDTLVKQYAPDADTAWDWMRKAHDMGWEWGMHSLGGPTASDPLGQRVNKNIATAFSNGDGVYVGICIVASAVRWGWFRAAEWGPRGRDLVLSGDRLHHETPIAAIAEYALIGEGTPMKKENVDDVFGGSWDD